MSSSQIDSEGISREYSEVTENIKVSVVPEIIESNSDPAANVFAFAYTVSIENLGSEKVQLLDRHWIIMSAGVQFAEVVGPGVVGEQPKLKPGGRYEYTSSAVIHDPFGSMHGTYTFRSDSGRQFDVVIPKFDLIYPLVIH